MHVEPVDEPGLPPDSEPEPESPLFGLRGRVQQIREERHDDVAVPDLVNAAGEPVDVRVRYGLVSHPFIQSTFNKWKAKRSRVSDWDLRANIDLLTKACRGIYAVVDGKEYAFDERSPDGDWPRFDERVAYTLGVETRTAADVCRALFVADGHIIEHADRVMKLAGYDRERWELDERVVGE